MELNKNKVELIINHFKSCFDSFVPFGSDKLISHLKLDGSTPNNPKKDKSVLFLQNGVMIENSSANISTNIFHYLDEYYNIPFKDVVCIFNDENNYQKLNNFQELRLIQ